MNKQQARHNLQFILGGARSGKSRLALKTAHELAEDSAKDLVFVATATGDDEEMKQRIKKHQAERANATGESPWTVVEESLSLAHALRQADSESSIILVDCLTLWISNCLHHKVWEEQKDKLLGCLDELRSTVIFVSNETGLGIVPMGELTREFVDASGFFHQRMAERCGKVTFTVAGLPHVLKDIVSTVDNTSVNKT